MSALLLLVTALLVWPRAPGPAARLTRADRVVAAAPGAPAGPVRRRALAALAGAVVLGVAGVGPGSLLAAVGVAVGVARWARRGAATGADDGARVRDDLPLVCDLLAVCLAAGTPVPGALGAVGAAAGGPLGRVLAGVAARLQLGAPARTAWRDVPADAAALARVVVRAGSPGRRWCRRCRPWPPTSGWPSGRRRPRRCSGPGCGCWPRWGCASCRRSCAWASCRWCWASPRTSWDEHTPAGRAARRPHPGPPSTDAVGPVRGAPVGPRVVTWPDARAGRGGRT
ncbi:type II secretion system F family protein [Klenkia terrae]|uniref:type II secretion system F family protein n=1 Tax=Klenkia terrae TaxID=1052259 RepID=UPI003621A050